MTPSSEPVRAVVLDALDQGGLADETWDRLAGESETSSVFQTASWHRSWWSAFGESYDARIVVVSRGARTIGLAPFVVDHRTPQLVRFMGEGRSDYCDVIASAEEKGPVLEAVLHALEGTVPWNILVLNNVPAASHTVDALREVCRRAGYGLLVTPQFVCPTLLIRDREDSARRIYNKASLRRPQNVLARSGPVVFRTLTTNHDVAPMLDLFFAQHVGRWEKTATPSLFLEVRNRTFYRALATALAERGWLHFSTVEFEGRPIAFHFGFDYGGTLTWYKPSFEMAYAARSPGMILLRHLIGTAIDRGLDELDFTVGDEPFKRRFTNGTRQTVKLRVFRDPSSLLLERSSRAVIDAAKWISRRAPRGRLSGGVRR